MNEDENSADSEEHIEIEEVVTGAPPLSVVTENDAAALSQELEKAKSELLYQRAEFDNYRKRAVKERSDYLKYAAEPVLVGVLDVLDNFERALSIEVTSENFESFKKGVVLTADNLKNTLKKFGVTEIPSEGVPFDPNMHEAISSEETNEIPEGHISKAFRKTYKLHDRVIRPGQVVVARPKTEKKD